jgi:hypothetical protein
MINADVDAVVDVDRISSFFVVSFFLIFFWICQFPSRIMSVAEANSAVRADIFHFGSVLLAINASFYERVARLEEKEEAVFEAERIWQGRVEGKLESLGRQATLGLSLDVVRGVQRPVLAVFSLLLGVATNRTSFMVLCLLISFFFDPFCTTSYLLFVLGSRILQVYRKHQHKVRKCCKFFGLCAGEEDILDESSVPIPNPEPVPIPDQRTSFLSSIGSFLTKSVFPSVNLLAFFASAVAESTSGSSSNSQEAAFLIPDV